MRAIADTHTHTIASGHAFSTVLENVVAAKDCGLQFLAVTDHASAMPGAPIPLYFDALAAMLPQRHQGVYLLAGCEANVMDESGALDLPPSILQKLDWVIVSMHLITMTPIDRAAHTRAWLAVAANPDVDVMGHLGDGRFPFDHEPVIRACAQHGKIVEINAHSFTSRPGSADNCPDIARLCMRYRVPVVVSSDAHFVDRVGRVDAALTLLRELDFPTQLILNIDCARFARVLAAKTGRTFEEAVDP